MRELLARGERTFSVEFFPPKSGSDDAPLWQAVRELEALRPTFVSVTYGAGGSTQDRTLDLAGRIERETGMHTVAHLTCVDASAAELRHVVRRYADAGVRSVLALRGDPTAGPGTPWITHPQGFRYALELIHLLRELGDFTIGVAAFPEKHPESPSIAHDCRVLAEKQRAGAHYAVTQLFFNPLDYFALVDRARANGVTIPIIPGILPITNVGQIERIVTLSGAIVPETLRVKFDAVRHDDAAVRELGIRVAADLAFDLLDGGAPGLHFYTMNRSTSTLRVFEQLAAAGLTTH